MRRLASVPRDGWEKLVESQGLVYHTPEGVPYWEENAYYQFSSAQIDVIEKATYELDKLCLQAVEHVIRNNLFPQFQIAGADVGFIVQSWERDEHTIYGRFDFAYDGVHPPKLLEYNADTPTSLLEASVIQWHWMKQMQQEMADPLDQFNSIHEKLIDAWRSLKPETQGPVVFTAMPDHVEDFVTVTYLRDTAVQAGLKTAFFPIEQIGWNKAQRTFVCNEVPATWVFKLYPWEWMLREEFGPMLSIGRTRWLEPPWKMLLSNKAILPILYELNPDCPYLLRSEREPFGSTFVKKPILGREGACVTIVLDGKVVAQTEGIDLYAASPCIYQEFSPLPNHGGNFPVLGSWMVNGYACGMGIREDTGLVTQNTSRFVPHLFTN